MSKVIHSDEGLLDAARSVFATNGFEAARMDAIAAAAGATKPTLYGRFGSPPPSACCSPPGAPSRRS